MSTYQSTAPILVISGPSGSGKTSICRQVANDLNWYYSISHTTRPQRNSETNGKDYFFVTKEKFKTMVQKDEMLEWAKVYDNFYGTSKKIIQEKQSHGQGVVFDVDTQGAASIKKLIPNAILIFIKTPSLKELEKRLRARKTDSDQELNKRLRNAESEMSHISEYDYVVVNDEFNRAVNEVKDIVNCPDRTKI